MTVWDPNIVKETNTKMHTDLKDNIVSFFEYKDTTGYLRLDLTAQPVSQFTKALYAILFKSYYPYS